MNTSSAFLNRPQPVPVEPLKCYSCGYRWLPRTMAVPQRCPRCQCRRYFDPTLPERRTRNASDQTPEAAARIDAARYGQTEMGSDDGSGARS